METSTVVFNALTGPSNAGITLTVHLLEPVAVHEAEFMGASVLCKWGIPPGGFEFVKAHAESGWKLKPMPVGSPDMWKDDWAEVQMSWLPSSYISDVVAGTKCFDPERFMLRYHEDDAYNVIGFREETRVEATETHSAYLKYGPWVPISDVYEDKKAGQTRYMIKL